MLRGIYISIKLLHVYLVQDTKAQQFYSNFLLLISSFSQSGISEVEF